MVNRILIRQKVVQLLYSYLLTRSEFKVESAPETVSRDRRYAYTVYVDMLLLILRLSGYRVSNVNESNPLKIDKKLASNKVAQALSNHDSIKELILRNSSTIPADYDLQPLVDAIEGSALYKDYSKKRSRDLGDDVAFWVNVLKTIIYKDKDLQDALRLDENFTMHGFKNGVRQTIDTLENYADTKQMLKNAQKNLEASLDKAYELYLRMFALILDITAEQQRRIEVAKSKHIATADELNPDMRFVENALVGYLKGHEQFAELVKEYKILPIAEYDHLVNVLLEKITQSDVYHEYMTQKLHTFSLDVEFWRTLMKDIILPSDELAEELEDMSVYWNDDVQQMGTFVLKTLRQISNAGSEYVEFLPKYKDDEDAEFGHQLFMYAVKNQDQYRAYIDRFIRSDRWDSERQPFMDIVILTAAIAEIINYPAIPVPVTANEYIEIANAYSTAKSGAFVNGMLDAIVQYLKSENIINK